MNKIILVFTLLSCSFLFSCQSVKDGLSGRKGENSDEFLVKKKNPLVLPPNYMELPKPKSTEDINAEDLIEEATNVEKLIKNIPDKNETSAKKFGKAEDFVLENIK